MYYLINQIGNCPAIVGQFTNKKAARLRMKELKKLFVGEVYYIKKVG